MRKTVLFDLDGTLLDTLQDITSATNEILSRYGRAACTVAEMRDFVGNGARHQFRSSWKGDISEELLDEALELYRPYYAAHIPDTRPYDGIIELLKGLKADGFRMAVVTNKPVLPTTSSAISCWAIWWMWLLPSRLNVRKSPLPTWWRKPCVSWV